MNSLYPQLSSGPHPLHFRGITLGRLRSFLDSKYSSIKSVLYEERIEAGKLEHWASPGQDRTPFEIAIKQKYSDFQRGDKIGPSWTQHWFKLQFEVPANWSNKERITLEFDPSCEAMVFDSEGNIYGGITGDFGIDRRVDIILPRTGHYKLYIACTANGIFGNGLAEPNDPPSPNRYFTIETADLVAPRMEAWRLLWDFITISDLAHELPENSPLGNLALECANSIMNAFDSDLPDISSTLTACRLLAEKVLGKEWEKSDIFKGDSSDSASTCAIGNCHIDNAWLWDSKVTRDKVARSWSSQLDLLERYPEARFVASQAQQMLYVEQDYPLLFDRIKASVAKGKFQPIGGAWVEMDTNLPSGESLCRQFLFGQRYFKSRFGNYSRTFWLPDSFGYSGQIPQICRLSGFDFFFTQKLSWNQFNTFPHTTFFWTGIDSTQILTHMTPVETYTAQADVSDVIRSVAKHKSLQSGAANSLLAFGNGDGGGGPAEAMFESIRRMRAVANTNGELPKVTFATSVEDFYESILKKTGNGATIPVYNGELYFELHRGTYTSHGSIKFQNRKCENLLREIELVASLASIGGSNTLATKYRYPKDQIDKLWKGVLVNQFHDVLPGSAISRAYVEAEKIYEFVREEGGDLLEAGLRELIPGSISANFGSPGKAIDSRVEIIAFNTTPLPRREIVKTSLSIAKSLDNTVVQLSHDGEALLLVENLEGKMISKVTSVDDFNSTTTSVSAKAVGDDYVLENSTLKITVSSTGSITSIVDLAKDRELLKSAASFIILEDRPLNWEAWDVDVFLGEKKELITATSIKVVENGPLRAGLMINYHFGKSVIRAFVSLDALASVVGEGELAGLRFDLTVDWFEQHRFLKFELPLNISNENATYESQFGHVSRPTIRNTTYDRAKFEVVGHKFADLSEYGYGVAIINDCKYGYSCEGSLMRISLLRGPTSPAADCDQGTHKISFSVQPHASSFDASRIPQAAILFNNPSHLRQIPSATTYSVEKPFELVGDSNITLETIKRGEEDAFITGKGEKNLILRLYEARGGHGVADLFSKLPIKSVAIVDILERPIPDATELKIVKMDDRSSIKLKLRGFEILTLKITLA